MRMLSLLMFTLVFGLGANFTAEEIKLSLEDFKVLTPEGEEADNLGYNRDEEKLFFYINGVASAKVNFKEEGEYTLVIEASCDKAKEELAKIKIKLGDEVVKAEFALTTDAIKEYKFPIKVKQGETKLSVEFLNDTYLEGEYDLNLYLHAAKFEPKKK